VGCILRIYPVGDILRVRIWACGIHPGCYVWVWEVSYNQLLAATLAGWARNTCSFTIRILLLTARSTSQHLNRLVGLNFRAWPPSLCGSNLILLRFSFWIICWSVRHFDCKWPGTCIAIWYLVWKWSSAFLNGSIGFVWYTSSVQWTFDSRWDLKIFRFMLFLVLLFSTRCIAYYFSRGWARRVHRFRSLRYLQLDLIDLNLLDVGSGLCSLLWWGLVWLDWYS